MFPNFQQLNFTSIMFAKMRQMDRLFIVEKQPDAIDAFIEDFSSIMFANEK